MYMALEVLLWSRVWYEHIIYISFIIIIIIIIIIPWLNSTVP